VFAVLLKQYCLLPIRWLCYAALIRCNSVFAVRAPCAYQSFERFFLRFILRHNMECNVRAIAHLYIRGSVTCARLRSVIDVFAVRSVMRAIRPVVLLPHLFAECGSAFNKYAIYAIRLVC
jgi:hypothetical protein